MMTVDDRIRKLATASEICRLKSRLLLHEDADTAYDCDRAADEIDAVLKDIMRGQDLEDMHRECEYQDWLEEQSKFTDADLAACGLPVG
jgi:hypothetical protein